MTERLAEMTRRIGNVHQLEAVVTAMRAISGSRVQQAHAVRRSVRTYAEVVAQAIAQALPMAPVNHGPATGRTGRTAVAVFCAEQGFAGALSERMLAAALPDDGSSDLFLIGSRGASLAEERALSPVWHTAMVPQANLVTGLAGRIAEALYGWIADRSGDRVDVITPSWTAASGIVPIRRSLLPFDFRRFATKPTAQPPLTTLPTSMLLARLAEEYVLAELCDAALMAFAAENEARVAAMQSARNNLQVMLADLCTQERQIRQEEITAELVELVEHGEIGSLMTT